LKPLPRLTLSRNTPAQSSPSRPAGLSLLVHAAAAVAVVALSACSGTPAPHKDDSDFVYLLDRKPTWTEIQNPVLPPLPQAADVLQFDVSTTSNLNFGIDAKSLSVGQDGVVRFTAVISSPAGAHNIYYEGIRCDTYEWRLYAAANDAGTDWDHSVSNNWRRIENSELNAYQSALYVDYMCTSKMPKGKAKDIVNNIRFHRLSNQEYH